MEYIRITKENLEQEHICCAISNNKDVQVASKKSWLEGRLDEWLVFLKSVERGKCFIEYIPAENAWVPIDAKGLAYIDCFWVAGSFKGKGYANDLLSECIADCKAKGMHGLCVLSSPKKKPYLSDPKYLTYKGFKVCDETAAGINLMYLPFDSDCVVPKFKECAKNLHIEEDGYVLYYTSQCPFNAKYVPLLEAVAKEAKVKFTTIHIESKDEAQNVPAPCTSYALFYNREFLTNEVLSENKFLKMIEEGK